MGFSRQEHWSGFPCPSPGDLPNSGIEPESSAWGVDSTIWHQGSPSSSGTPSLTVLGDTHHLPSCKTVLLGFCCTEWINTYQENRIPKSVYSWWSVLRWAEIYLQCHPWLLGHYCELEEGRAVLRVGVAQGDWRCHPPHLPSRGADRGGLVTRYLCGGICLFTFLPVLFTDSFLHIPDRMRIYWWSLPPHPSVWGQGLWRLRPRGGTSQGGKECRSLILLESLLPQPGLHSQFWDRWIPSISEAYGGKKIMCIHGSLISFFPMTPKCTFINLIVTRELLVHLMFPKWVLYRDIATRGGNTGVTLDLPTTGWLWDHLTMWLLTELRVGMQRLRQRVQVQGFGTHSTGIQIKIMFHKHYCSLPGYLELQERTL